MLQAPEEAVHRVSQQGGHDAQVIAEPVRLELVQDLVQRLEVARDGSDTSRIVVDAEDGICQVASDERDDV